MVDEKIFSKEKTSIIFTGDIGFDRYMTGKWGDEELLSKKMLDYFKSADHVCINVEGAVIAVDESQPKGRFFHAMNPKAIDVFNKMGADIWSIGNNHTMDMGAPGVISTKEYARKNGVMHFGAGTNIEDASKPIYLNEAGGIGMFGISYMPEDTPATESEAGFFCWNDWDHIQKRIDEIKARCRWCVMVAHGGEEFASMPLPYTRERFLKYLDMGADVIVAHHPHVPESYETTKDGKIIFYSLGNFIFDTDYQRAHPFTDTGILLKLTFTEEKLKFSAVGTKLDRTTERLDLGELPEIFTDVDAEEYETLLPLAMKAYFVDEKRKMIFLKPEKYENADEEAWKRYFYSTDPDGYFKGQHMDLEYVAPFAEKAEDGEWKKSKLEKVKSYLLRQIKG